MEPLFGMYLSLNVNVGISVCSEFGVCYLVPGVYFPLHYILFSYTIFSSYIHPISSWNITVQTASTRIYSDVCMCLSH